MARKPNYQFERMERDRAKAAKVAAKAAAKRDERDREAGPSDPNPEAKPSDEG
ncbi:MAG: hypothetical protein JWP49_2884 [Phenylobacterium sp.]|jgi:hypothetical protein|nr:hypothetical protein [Phenylobacterium sp.]